MTRPFSAGKVKRNFTLTELSGVEEVAKELPDAERSIIFKFFETASKEARRQFLFVSKKQRDAFLEEV